MDTKSIDANLHPLMDSKDDDLMDTKQTLADGYEALHLLMGTRSIDMNSMDSKLMESNPRHFDGFEVDRYEGDWFVRCSVMDSKTPTTMDAKPVLLTSS